MSYISKYTGNEIDELLDKVKNNQALKVTLWEGTLNTISSAVALKDSVQNYDFILVQSAATTAEDGKPDGGIESRLVDVESIQYTGSTKTLAPSYNIYSHTGSSAYYRLGFAFVDEFNFFVMAKTVGGTGWTNPRINKIIGIKLNHIAKLEDIAPIGNIISFMGTKAPNGYLVCDGAELEISKYAQLAAHFEEQFGTKNHFGGDGTTTFAVPDLRNEFLRGYHANKEEQLSGEVGEHQDATNHSIVGAYGSEHKIFASYLATDKGEAEGLPPYGADTHSRWNDTYSMAGRVVGASGYINGNNDTQFSHYTSRPTNVAVLYCIKY